MSSGPQTVSDGVQGRERDMDGGEKGEIWLLMICLAAEES